MNHQNKINTSVIPTMLSTKNWVREHDNSYPNGISGFETLKLEANCKIIRKGNRKLTNRISKVPFIQTPQDDIIIELLKYKLAAACKQKIKNVWSNLLFNLPNPVELEEQDYDLQKLVIHTLLNMGEGEIYLAHVEQLTRTLAKQVHHDFFVDTSSAE